MSMVHVHVSMYHWMYIKQPSLQKKKYPKHKFLTKLFFLDFFFTIRLQQINITIYHLSGDPWKNNMMTTGNLS